MAVTEWVAVGAGVSPSTLGAVAGIVVNGGSPGGYILPDSGRLYPNPNVQR